MKIITLFILVALISSVFAEHANYGKWNILGISSLASSIKNSITYNLAEDAITKKPVDTLTFKLENSKKKTVSSVVLAQAATAACTFETPFVTVTSKSAQPIFKMKGVVSEGDSNKFYFLTSGGTCSDGSKLANGTIIMGESVSGNRFVVSTNKLVSYKDDQLKFNIESGPIKKLTGVRLTKVKQSDSCDLIPLYTLVTSSKPSGVFEVQGPLSKGSSNRFYLSMNSATCVSGGKLNSGRIIMPDSVDRTKYVVGITTQVSVFK
ncbi:hypothetical protein HYT84_03665 [Candidatus Micrarchaeota archaeon]|nr:hypothetical protein [Candidatus Micrarchaeota archaeon]